MIWAMLAFDLGLLIEVAPLLKSRMRKLLLCFPSIPAAWLLLVIGAIDLTWYHRPLARLRVIEPGKIYMSAMPTLRGLEVEQARLPVPNDHQPVSGRDRAGEPTAAGGAEIRARARDSLPWQSIGPFRSGLECVSWTRRWPWRKIRRRGRSWCIATAAWTGRRRGWASTSSWSRDGRYSRSCRRSSGTEATGPRRRSSCCTTGSYPSVRGHATGPTRPRRSLRRCAEGTSDPMVATRTADRVE